MKDCRAVSLFVILFVLSFGVMLSRIYLRQYATTADLSFSGYPLAGTESSSNQIVNNTRSLNIGGINANKSSNLGEIPTSSIESMFAQSTSSNLRMEPGLFIHVHSWNEGMAAWRKSFSNLISIARKLNATLVEPGIRNGRLTGDEGNVQFTDVFNQTLIHKFHPKFVTLQEFGKIATNNSMTGVFDLCLDQCLSTSQNCKKKGPKPCEDGTMASDFKKKRSDALDRAIQSSRVKPTVINMYKVWKDSLHNVEAEHGNSFGRLYDEKDSKDAQNHLQFRDSLYEMADLVLEDMGIIPGSEFATVHWRAERPNIDYVNCAKSIVAASKNMGLQSPDNATFVLMSSLSTNTSMQWAGSRARAMGTNSDQALQLLLHDHGFKMVDQIFDKFQVKDLIISAVLDLIIAQKSTKFATCTRDCKNARNKHCLSCNHAGLFALLAIKLRNAESKESWSCWPEKLKK